MERNPNWKRDELILALELYFRVDPLHTNAKDPEIIALSKLLNILPIHAKSMQLQDFRNPNGVYMKLCNFLRLDDSYHGKGLTSGSKMDEDVWSEFANDRDHLKGIVEAIRHNATAIPLDLEDDFIDSDEEFPEGKFLTRIHIHRERNSQLVRKKKQQVIDETGKLACEICEFDFSSVYGEVGRGFAECHHNKPLCTLLPNEKTKLSDLSVVCANCHQMIHRKKPWLSPVELRRLVFAGLD